MSSVEEIEEEKPNTGLLHAALGVLGFIPGPIGVVADLANAAVYAAVDHDYGMAALSVVSAVSSVAGSVAKVAAAEAGVAAKAGQTVAQVNALGRMAKATKVKSTFDLIGNVGRGVMATQRMAEDYSTVRKMTESADYVSTMDFVKQTAAVMGDGLAVAFSVNGLTGALQGFGTAQNIENLQLELAKQNTTSVVTGQMMYLDDFEGLPGCFVAGTKIQTQEGEKNIEDIKVGDKVYAFNADTKELGLKEVKTLYIHYSDQLVKVKINGETIEATSNHPFYVVGEGFKPAGELKQSDRVHLLDGSITVVESVEPVDCDEAVKVYNFEVADYHTYFVGDTGVLVHNVCWHTRVEVVL